MDYKMRLGATLEFDSGKELDLKFVNDTPGNLYIKAVADGRDITFTFFGEKPKYRYERVSVILSEIPPDDDEIVLDGEMFEGETITVRKAKNGIKSEGYLVLYSGSVKIENVKLHTDTYKSIRAQVKVGSKPKVLIDNGDIIG